ncbi:unannotated protein [freshwater metagenome]|uniref:Unannotated protein n=1 Tax=freshwater metagenome TaxID=449393 RepID=A0A6J7EIM3_9ZZZZ|nr:DUF3662 domain-containing protein [Actinomycetota bacterium]
MSVLRNLESKLAGLVEGTFGRVFRTEVRPVELARGLAREMDDHRSSRPVPHAYIVHLSPDDHARYTETGDEVREDLAGYLLEHARAERFSLAATPVILLDCDPRLGLGEFGVEALPAGSAPAPPVSRPPAPIRRDPRPPRGVLAVAGRRFAITEAGALIGRSRDCEVVLDDANVSRHHARIAFDAGAGWTIEDLGSTNGVRVNGERIHGPAALRTGDRLDIGTLSASFEDA